LSKPILPVSGLQNTKGHYANRGRASNSAPQHSHLQDLQPSPGAIGEGAATLTVPYDSAYDGIFKSFHGGLLMTLADTAACIAVLTLAGPGVVITTTDMNIRFLAACRSDTTAEAKIIKFGKTLCPLKSATPKALEWPWPRLLTCVWAEARRSPDADGGFANRPSIPKTRIPAHNVLSWAKDPLTPSAGSRLV
jgi:uncharacterized protein (TIGR00369 family)